MSIITVLQLDHTSTLEHLEAGGHLRRLLVLLCIQSGPIVSGPTAPTVGTQLLCGLTVNYGGMICMALFSEPR